MTADDIIEKMDEVFGDYPKALIELKDEIKKRGIKF